MYGAMVGVYPIATANDKSQISAPLMSRFAVIDIPDYTGREKIIFFAVCTAKRFSDGWEWRQRNVGVTPEGAGRDY